MYVVRCRDGSLYTGIARNVATRIREHNGEGTKGAKYTRSRRPVTLAFTKRCKDKGWALKREYAFKQLSKVEKERLLANYKRRKKPV